MGHVTLMGEKKNPCTMGKPEGKRPLEGHGRRGRVMIQFVLKKLYGRTWTGLLWLRIGTSGGLL